MRADVLVGPSPWVVERFGERVAGELWTRVPEALRTAIDRAANARPHVSYATDRLLANPRWPVPYEELVVYLRNLPGAEVIAPRGSAYQLVAFRGQVVVPWCYGQSGAVSMRDVEPAGSFGRLARELVRRFGLPGQRWAVPLLPMLRDEIDQREVGQVCAALGAMHWRPGVLIAGYAGSADHGLLRACLGEVAPGSSGFLGWRHVDDLPLPVPVIPRPRRMVFP
jgi:hypothetical protein